MLSTVPFVFLLLLFQTNNSFFMELIHFLNKWIYNLLLNYVSFVYFKSAAKFFINIIFLYFFKFRCNLIIYIFISLKIGCSQFILRTWRLWIIIVLKFQESVFISQINMFVCKYFFVISIIETQIHEVLIIDLESRVGARMSKLVPSLIKYENGYIYSTHKWNLSSLFVKILRSPIFSVTFLFTFI